MSPFPVLGLFPLTNLVVSALRRLIILSSVNCLLAKERNLAASIHSVCKLPVLTLSPMAKQSQET